MYGTDSYTTQSEHGSDFMLGVLCGAAVGAAIGLLLAPKSGAELRGQLAGSAERFRRRAGETYEQASGAVNEMVDKGRRSFDEAIDRGRNAAQGGRSSFDESNSMANEGAPSNKPY